MPWDNDDAFRHTHKANTPKKKRQWRHVANSVLKNGGDEASAIRQANAVVAKSNAFDILCMWADYGLRKAVGNMHKEPGGVFGSSGLHNHPPQPLDPKKWPKERVEKQNKIIAEWHKKKPGYGIKTDKAIANVAHPYQTEKVRPFARINKLKQNKTAVNSFRRKRFLNG